MSPHEKPKIIPSVTIINWYLSSLPTRRFINSPRHIYNHKKCSASRNNMRQCCIKYSITLQWALKRNWWKEFVSLVLSHLWMAPFTPWNRIGCCSIILFVSKDKKYYALFISTIAINLAPPLSIRQMRWGYSAYYSSGCTGSISLHHWVHYLWSVFPDVWHLCGIFFCSRESLRIEPTKMRRSDVNQATLYYWCNSSFQS
jgi:hypothetical protein